MKSTRLVFFFFNFLFLIFNTDAQTNLAAKLGYDENAKLLIIHADDIGVSHSENIGSFLAMETGVVNSGSIMMPCPWVPEVAEYVKAHPDADLGLHLTLTAEWKYMKWGPVAPVSKVPSLISENGYFYSDCLQFGQHADPAEVKIELRAQIEKAIKMGIHPTHLDSHMACLLFSSPEVFGTYLELGREYKIPVMVGHFFLKAAPQSFLDLLTEEDIVIEKSITAGPQDYLDGMTQFYENVLNSLEPGVQILLIHTAYNNTEMRALTIDHLNWGAEWRQQDFDFFTSQKAKNLILKNNIKLITWRDIQKVIHGP